MLSQRAAGAATFAATVQESAGARIDLYYGLPDYPSERLGRAGVIQVGEQFGGPARRPAVKSRFAGESKMLGPCFKREE